MASSSSQDWQNDTFDNCFDDGFFDNDVDNYFTRGSEMILNPVVRCEPSNAAFRGCSSEQDQLTECLDVYTPTFRDSPVLMSSTLSTDNWLMPLAQPEPEASNAGLAQTIKQEHCHNYPNAVKAKVPTAAGGVQKDVSHRRGPKAEHAKLINCITLEKLQKHANAALMLGISATMAKRIAKHHRIKALYF